jgi:predicted phosphodiesterase
MQRTRQDKKPTAILCSDFHLREDTPICYTGDYQEEQWRCVDFISDLQRKYDCWVFHGGDLFDKWKPSPWLLRQAILHLPTQFHTCYGQHDLPQHSLDLINKCGINVLEAAKKLTVVGTHWGQTPSDEPNFWYENTMIGSKPKGILIWHKLVYKGEAPFPGATGGQASMILRKYPLYDLILTGDNHMTCTATYGDQILVNPGSMMRMDADQFDFKPSVFLWFAETNTIEQIFLPIKQDVISREHLNRAKERDSRIDAFVSRLDANYESAISFEENLDNFFKVNRIRKGVKDIIYKAID